MKAYQLPANDLQVIQGALTGKRNKHDKKVYTLALQLERCFQLMAIFRKFQMFPPIDTETVRAFMSYKEEADALLAKLSKESE